MDAVDRENTFVVEQTTAFVYESALNARRKRMEIRRSKKSSSLSVPSRSLNFVQQGAFKLSRPRRTSSICSACYYDNDCECDCDSPALSKRSNEIGLPFVTKLFAEIEVPHNYGVVKGRVSTGSRLFRSKSVPLEQMHTGQCILHITKASHDHVAVNVGDQAKTVDNYNHESIVKEASSDLHSLPAQKISRTDSNKSMGVSRGMPQSGCKESLSVVAQEVCESILGLNPANIDAEDPGISSNISSGRTEVIEPIAPVRSSAFTDPQILQKCPCPLSGKVLVCGRRREMEDAVIIAPSFMCIPRYDDPNNYCDLHFFAIYDGHGGSQASNFCAGRLHHALAEELARSSVSEGMEDDLNWQKVMASCFMKVDQEVGGVCPNGVCDEHKSEACCVNAIAPQNVGTTAVVAVFCPSKIVLANCGDSRAVLSRGGVAIPVTKDHKPERDDETSRIEAAGGCVICWDGYRVSGLLALSRAIGDRYLKEYVISEPDVLCLPRTEDDECLILASDGLWDVIDNETACDVARRCLASARKRPEHRRSRVGEDTASAAVAALLVKLAYGRGSKDNISVVVIDLKSRLL